MTRTPFFDRMLAGHVIGLRLLEDEERDDVVLDALEAAFDEELVSNARGVVQSAPYLSPPSVSVCYRALPPCVHGEATGLSLATAC